MGDGVTRNSAEAHGPQSHPCLSRFRRLWPSAATVARARPKLGPRLSLSDVQVALARAWKLSTGLLPTTNYTTSVSTGNGGSSYSGFNSSQVT